MSAVDEREAKLPAWVREALRSARGEAGLLASQLETAQAELAALRGAGPANSDTFLDLNSGRHAIGRGAYVVFQVSGPDGRRVDEITCRVDRDGCLEVDIDSATAGLAVVPVARNSIRVGVARLVYGP